LAVKGAGGGGKGVKAFERIAAGYRSWLARWVAGTARRARLVVALAVVATLAATFHFVEAIKINTSTTDMLAKDVPFRQYAREIDGAFPQLQETLVVVIEGASADLADDAALRLGAKLRAMPKLFADVFDLKGDPFFRANGLLYLDTDALYKLSDRLAAAQPFLGTLWQDRTLAGLFRMMGLAAEEAAKPGGTQALPVADVFAAVAGVAEALKAGRFDVLSWSQLLEGKAGQSAPASERRRFLIVKPRLDFGSLQPAEDAIDGIRALAREAGIDATHGLSVRLTGSAAMEQEELSSVEKGMGLAAVLSLVLVLGILIAGLGSLRLVAATIITLIMGLIWTASFALIAVGSLNLISVAFAVLFIGLSVDFGIHYGLRYRENRATTDDNGTALAAAAEGVGGPLTLCAVSAAISFFAFLPTDYVGLAELGVIAGSGMFIALFANLTVLPALMALMPAPRRATAGKPRAMAAVGRGTARTIAIAIGGLTLVACIAVPSVRFDFDPLNLKDPKTESVSTLLDLMRDGARNHYSGEVLTPNLDAAQELAKRLDALPEVDHTISLASFIPQGQEEKLQVIGDMALFLGPSLSVPAKAADIGDGGRRAAWAALAPKLDNLAHNGEGSVAAQAKRLAEALHAVFADAKPDMPAELERRLLIGLGGRLEALKAALSAAPVKLETLPTGLKARWIAADGRALVEVFPKGEVADRDRLDAFVEAVRKLAPRLSGAPVTILEAGRTVLGAFLEAGAIAVAGISVMLLLVLGRLRDILLVFVPVVMAGLWTMALAVAVGLAFNLANVIVLPLLFGLGVAGAIHLVARACSEGGSAGAMDTSTPRAVVLSALTTIGSFGSISLSSHPGTASMGVLLTIAITMTMVASLVFLPALMRMLEKGGPDRA
jgi:hopanoid biosynthesis associated RND transporter like protein HpnN